MEAFPSAACWNQNRHLNIANYAFSGIPQFVQEYRDPQSLQHMYNTSDLVWASTFTVDNLLIFVDRDEIPEFIATLEPLESGFVLRDPKDPRWIDMTRRKHHFAELLRDASRILRSSDSESALDPINLTVIRSLTCHVNSSHASADSIHQNEYERLWRQSRAVSDK
jgi:proteasome activator subunit 4